MIRPCTPDDPCLLLVVEDDSMIREMFESWKTQSGRLAKSINFKFATTCKQALNLLESIQFEVVLLDLGLPDSEGLRTLDRICELVKDRTPVIVFSGSLPAEIKEEEVFRHGAADIVFKPGPGIEEMMRLIDYAAARNRIRMQYRVIIERLTKEIAEAQLEIAELQAFVPVATHAAALPGPGLQRLERIIARIGKLATG